MSNLKVTPNGVELHIGGADGTVVMQSGPYAGLQAKLVGRGIDVRGGAQVRVVHSAPTLPFLFDPAYAVNAQPAPDQAAIDASKPIIPKEVEAPPAIVTEVFTSSTPLEANPFADIQTVSFDEETPFEVASKDGAQELESKPEAGTPADMLQQLQDRDLTKFGITNSEFNTLGLSTRQTWKLYEQVIGRSTNRPAIQQAAEAILKRANANASDYTRVVQAIVRVVAG